MRINNNLQAMNTHRQLGMATTSGAKSMEKLSSGFRINRAGDDAAGLAISEKMRGQIRGLNRASANAQDGISLIQTAEGALNETHAILQRMRELAVQSATDTNTEDDRAEIQKEINQLTSEINRIGNTTEFNTMKLVDGSRSTEKIVRTDGQKTVAGAGGELAIKNAQGVTINDDAWKSAIASGITITKETAETDAIDWSDVDLSTATDNAVTLTKNADGSLKIEIAAKGKATADVSTYSMTIDKDSLAAAKDGIYKVDIHGVSFDLNVEEFNKVADDETVKVDPSAKLGKSATDATGTYELDSDYATGYSDFEFFKIDGKNLELAGVTSLEVELNADLKTVTIKGYDANGTETFSDSKALATALVKDGTYEYNEHGINFKFKVLDSSTPGNAQAFKTKKLNVKDFVATKEDIVVETKEENEGKESLTFQVGANEKQSMSLEIGDMRAEALGISTKESRKGFEAGKAITDGTDNTSVEHALNVSTREGAASSITTIQNAINMVSSQRSALGAVQNRLEHTIKNLDTSSENLQASEARIRDVDMAKEMMEQTKQNILSQAATAMLAQANQAPQGVLQLLR